MIEILFLIWYSENFHMRWDKMIDMKESANGNKVGVLGRKHGYKATDISIEEYSKVLTDDYNLDVSIHNEMTFPLGTKVSRKNLGNARMIQIKTDKVFFFSTVRDKNIFCTRNFIYSNL